jgi:phosphatidylglycerophosphate synthase
MTPSSPLTLPNALTLLRILAIPFFAIAVWYGHHWQAFILFAAAGFTDLLDGLIARAFNQRSDLGAVLDPAADKLLMTTAFILMAWRTEGMAAAIPSVPSPCGWRSSPSRGTW